MKLLFAKLFIAMSCFYAVSSGAQPRSNFNLRKVAVHLMDGRIIIGPIIRMDKDSLVIRARIRSSYDPWTVGNEVTFRLKEVPFEYDAIVLAVTDTVISVRLNKKPNEISTVYRKYVTAVKVKRFVKRPQGANAELIRLASNQVKSVRLHRKGSGFLGFFAGGLVGGLISTAIAVNNFWSSGNGPMLGAATIFFVSPFLGAGLATIGSTHSIEGDQMKYEAFVAEVVKKDKPRAARTEKEKRANAPPF